MAYSNYYVGTSDAMVAVPTSLPAVEVSFDQTKLKIEALVALSKHATRETTHLRRSASTAGQSVSVTTAEMVKIADEAYASLQQCLDLVREQDKVRY